MEIIEEREKKGDLHNARQRDYYRKKKLERAQDLARRMEK